MKNHGKIDPARLSPGTRQAIMLLAQYLREEPGLDAVQVTFDRETLTGEANDIPPTVHVIIDPAHTERWGIDQ